MSDLQEEELKNYIDDKFDSLKKNQKYSDNIIQKIHDDFSVCLTNSTLQSGQISSISSELEKITDYMNEISYKLDMLVIENGHKTQTKTQNKTKKESKSNKKENSKTTNQDENKKIPINKFFVLYYKDFMSYFEDRGIPSYEEIKNSEEFKANFYKKRAKNSTEEEHELKSIYKTLNKNKDYMKFMKLAKEDITKALNSPEKETKNEKKKKNDKSIKTDKKEESEENEESEESEEEKKSHKKKKKEKSKNKDDSDSETELSSDDE